MTIFLNEVQLMRNAPSIFATGRASKTSERYAFIPSIDVVRGLGRAGFKPVMAAQTKSRDANEIEHKKHLIRFRHESSISDNGLIPEIVLVNSHDGSTSYQLRAGIYRLVCTNGLIVGNDSFLRRVKHKGNVIESVVEAASDLLEIVPLSVRKAQEWEATPLKIEQQTAFAEAASMLKWDQDNVAIDPKRLLSPRRVADSKKDLWTTLNVIQENLIRGGVRYRTESHQRQSTRAINSVSENVRLNTALWTLTERMAELIK